MFHEIDPHTFDIQMLFVEAHDDDLALLYGDGENGGAVGEVWVAHDENSRLVLPACGELSGDVRFVYLFSVDDQRIFLATGYSGAGMQQNSTATVPRSFEFQRVISLFVVPPDPFVLAAVTGMHLDRWYRDNVFCGRCGAMLRTSDEERALVCDACAHVVYPRISPAVIVAVTNGDKLLLTRYAQGSYRKRALVAGFVEVGETPERAVVREVFEECGVRVKNVRYFASQPWGISGSLMLGFFAELDGGPSIELRDGELSWAGWVPRSEIDSDDDYALGRAMIDAFCAS